MATTATVPTSIKVIYFNVPRRAETTRMMLAYGEIPFEDERIAFKDFPQLRENWPYTQLPVMEVDGEIIAQSGAMERYVAKLANLYPSDPLAAARVDQLTGAIYDVMNKAVEIHMSKNKKYTDERNAEVKAERIEDFNENVAPQLVGGMEKLVRGKFMLGDETPTYADIFFYCMMKHGVYEKIPGFTWEPYPKLKKVYENVETLPTIANYLSQQEARKKQRTA